MKGMEHEDLLTDVLQENPRFESPAVSVDRVALYAARALGRLKALQILKRAVFDAWSRRTVRCCGLWLPPADP